VAIIALKKETSQLFLFVFGNIAENNFCVVLSAGYLYHIAFGISKWELPFNSHVLEPAEISDGRGWIAGWMFRELYIVLFLELCGEVNCYDVKSIFQTKDYIFFFVESTVVNVLNLKAEYFNYLSVVKEQIYDRWLIWYKRNQIAIVPTSDFDLSMRLLRCWRVWIFLFKILTVLFLFVLIDPGLIIDWNIFIKIVFLISSRKFWSNRCCIFFFYFYRKEQNAASMKHLTTLQIELSPKSVEGWIETVFQHSYLFTS
jgi:hypothetical protein